MASCPACRLPLLSTVSERQSGAVVFQCGEGGREGGRGGGGEGRVGQGRGGE